MKSSLSIIQYQKIGKLIVNRNSLYATYISEIYHYFYASENEALALCQNPDYGTRFNNTWFQGKYTHFLPGDLFSIKGTNNVYISGESDRIPQMLCHISNVPFLEWVDFIPSESSAE